uniref:Cyt3Aa1 n=1 Tax=Bacillus thuringiensis TaxID=1428 RepID=A0A0U1S5R6_BACTU|nr:Cyt3Aa1 [Bacillus thuringiensis]
MYTKNFSKRGNKMLGNNGPRVPSIPRPFKYIVWPVSSDILDTFNKVFYVQPNCDKPFHYLANAFQPQVRILLLNFNFEKALCKNSKSHCSPIVKSYNLFIKLKSTAAHNSGSDKRIARQEVLGLVICGPDLPLSVAYTGGTYKYLYKFQILKHIKHGFYGETENTLKHLRLKFVFPIQDTYTGGVVTKYPSTLSVTEPAQTTSLILDNDSFCQLTREDLTFELQATVAFRNRPIGDLFVNNYSILQRQINKIHNLKFS